MAQLRERLDNELKGSCTGSGRSSMCTWTSTARGPRSEETIRERCRQKVRDADIVLILYDGRAGWSAQDTIPNRAAGSTVSLTRPVRRVFPQAPLTLVPAVRAASSGARRVVLTISSRIVASLTARCWRTHHGRTRRLGRARRREGVAALAQIRASAGQSRHDCFCAPAGASRAIAKATKHNSR